MAESTRAWRLAMVLGELQFPAQKWTIQTAADLYGADVRTRTELQDLPEVVYHDIEEVVSAVEAIEARTRPLADPPETQCCRGRA